MVLFHCTSFGMAVAKGSKKEKKEEKKNMRKKILTLALTGTLILGSLVPVQVQGADKTYISGKEYVKMLEKVTGKKIDTSNVTLGTKVSYADAAVLAERADILKNGTKVSDALKTKKSNITKYKRISDLTKIPKVKRAEVVSCFAKGIFTGKSNGTYSQSDTMSTKLYINKSQARAIRNRIKSTKTRKTITEDGQVTRTTNLPKNAKKFPYILESIPNSFYDSYFNWEGKVKYFGDKTKLRYPKNVINGTHILWDEKVPAKEIIDKYRYEWAEKVKKNVSTRLNFNYKTVSNKWINDLQSTYFVYGNSYDKYTTNDIKSYITKAKKNHVIIKCNKVVVEPSSLYYGTDEYAYRCYAKFTIKADKKAFTRSAQENNELIYSGFSEAQWLEGAKNGKTFNLVFDISMGTSAMNDDGHGYAVNVYGDQIWDNMRK